MQVNNSIFRDPCIALELDHEIVVLLSSTELSQVTGHSFLVAIEDCSNNASCQVPG